jgi:hypothetical protein
MPGNTIRINNNIDLDWYVGDSGMDRVIDLLNQVGVKNKPQPDEEKVIHITDKEPTPMKMLDQWLKELVFPGKVKDFIEEVSNKVTRDEHKRELCFYTEDNCYFINVVVRKNEGKHYIGCQVNSRKSRPGEDWIRGNDLSDGPFSKETWDRIIYAIVRYELVKLTPYKKPESIPEDVA